MTDPEKPGGKESVEEEVPPSGPDPMSALLKRSLDVPAPAPEHSILRGVQRRIRKRSRGKFFADGWSTSDGRVSHALIAAAMLLIVLVAYFALGPTGVQ
jgi:hypothetical protein